MLRYFRMVRLVLSFIFLVFLCFMLLHFVCNKNDDDDDDDDDVAKIGHDRLICLIRPH